MEPQIFDTIYSAGLYSTVQEIIKAENSGFSLELPLFSYLSKLGTDNYPAVYDLLHSKKNNISNLKRIKSQDFLFELNKLSATFSSVHEFSKKLSLRVIVIDQYNKIIENISNFCHHFFIEIYLQKNDRNKFISYNSSFIQLQQNDILNENKKLISNLQGLKDALKNKVAQKQLNKEFTFNSTDGETTRVENEPVIEINSETPKTFIGEIQGNRINLFRVSQGSKFVKPVLCKLETLNKMMQSSSYKNEFVKSITIQFDFQFPKQQIPPN